jgi:hypothetical protein
VQACALRRGGSRRTAAGGRSGRTTCHNRCSRPLRRRVITAPPNRPAVQAPVLGTGRGDLRRQILDPPGDRTNHPSITRIQREQRGTRRSLPRFRQDHECPPDERQRLALEPGARIHPQYKAEFETAFSLSWPRVPWSRGSWRSESNAAHEALIALRQPDGRMHFAGDYRTNMTSWMQAFESAREVAAATHRRAPTRS